MPSPIRRSGSGTRSTLRTAPAGTPTRARWPDAQRYWEGAVEFDVVRLEGENLVVGEVKWRTVTRAERQSLRDALEAKFHRTSLAKKFPSSRFEVFDASALKDLARER